ncbi:MAG TPA: hypothetical protein VGL60_05125 [Acidimicrobiales bacterium]|jgi:aryl-alcohol dehydrogenase (NADP+)
MLSKPIVTAPIVGATKPNASTAPAAVDLTLNSDEIGLLEEPYVPHEVAGSV